MNRDQLAEAKKDLVALRAAYHDEELALTEPLFMAGDWVGKYADSLLVEVERLLRLDDREAA